MTISLVHYLSISISLKVGESYKLDYVCTTVFKIPRSVHGLELRTVLSLTGSSRKYMTAIYWLLVRCYDADSNVLVCI